MKRAFPLLTALLLSTALFGSLRAGGPADAPQATIIIDIEDMWGIWVMATDPDVNALERVRVLDANGTIVYIDRNADPEQEWISYQGWAAGTYRVQSDMEIGYDAAYFTVGQ
jgi:hypothetical protein